MASFEHLSGADLVEKGIDDLEHGPSTVEALLVSIGTTWLDAIGEGVSAVLLGWFATTVDVLDHPAIGGSVPSTARGP